MIYLRCPFCKKVSGYVDGNVILKEPIENYYSNIGDIIHILYSDGMTMSVNGLVAFVHVDCHVKHMDVESRRKKVMEGLKLGQ
jgi:hypothetical protein